MCLAYSFSARLITLKQMHTKRSKRNESFIASMTFRDILTNKNESKEQKTETLAPRLAESSGTDTIQNDSDDH